MDPVADMLVTIKNGYMAKKPFISVPLSKLKLDIIKVLEKQNFVGKVEKKDKSLTVELLYQDKKPKIHDIKRVSKLGRRVYSRGKHLKWVKGGRGILVVSTPQGVMDSKEAKTKNLGGEVICEVW